MFNKYKSDVKRDSKKHENGIEVQKNGFTRDRRV